MSSTHETEGDPTYEDVVAAYARLAIYAGDGPMLAEVLSYDSARQKATVKPLFHIWRGDRFQRIPGFEVDVAWPRGDQFAATFPLAQGVIVQLLAQTVDSSPHQSGSKDVAPPTKRRNQLTDSVAVPIGVDPSQPLPAAAVANDGYVIYAQPFIYLGGSNATDFVALANLTAAAFASRKTWADGHTHAAGTLTNPAGPVTGVTGPPVSAAPGVTADDIRSQVVKSL